jgi:gamma-glutamyl-gamma-aminobutyrate hydrolase PuuD
LKKVNTNTFYRYINLQKNIIKRMMAVIESPGNSPDNYVAWLESVGIPVLIPYNIPKGDLLYCLQRVDGVVWTGGAIEKTKYDKERPVYLDTLYTTFEAAKKYNKNVPYPIFGICQGLEMLYLFRDGKPTTIDLPKHVANENTPITFRKSILRDWFSTMRTEMARTPCSEQHHTYGVDIQPMKDIRILSTQDDYVNILKYKDYPFYGVMFHVERPFDAFSATVSKQFALFLKSLL